MLACEGIPIDKFLFGLVMAISLHAFDDIAIITMLPVVVEQLQGQTLFGASFFAYLLASVISLVWAGAHTDRYGPRRAFVAGLSVFVVGLAVGASATAMWQFVAGRALQGLGGGAIHAVVFASINLAYDEAQRKKAVAFATTGWIVPALLAPAIAGYVTQYWDWHWVFWGMIPFAVLVGVITFQRLGNLQVQNPITKAQASHHLVILRAARIAIGIGLLLGAISLMQGIAMVITGLIAMALFWAPLKQVFPAGIWLAKPGLGAALALKFLIVFGFFGAEAFIPVLLKNEFGFTPFQAGTVLTGAALTWTAATWIYERYAERVKIKTVLLAGCSFMFVGILVLVAGLTWWQTPEIAYLAWALSAFGMGLVYPLTMISVMSNTTTGSEGHTSTGAGMVDALGFSFSAGIGGALLNITSDSGWPLVQSVQCIWILMMGVVLLALWVSYSRYTT